MGKVTVGKHRSTARLRERGMGREKRRKRDGKIFKDGRESRMGRGRETYKSLSFFKTTEEKTSICQ